MRLTLGAPPRARNPRIREPRVPTTPLERFNREIGRRTDVVGIFPDDQSLIRLTSMLATKANDEWLVGRGYVARHTMEPLPQERLHHDQQPEEVLEIQAA